MSIMAVAILTGPKVEFKPSQPIIWPSHYFLLFYFNQIHTLIILETAGLTDESSPLF